MSRWRLRQQVAQGILCHIPTDLRALGRWCCVSPLDSPNGGVPTPDTRAAGPRLRLVPGGRAWVATRLRDGVLHRGAKLALARFVPLLTRPVPHGGTTVPSTLVTWSRLNPASTGKTDGRGTTSRRRYRLNDPWYHRGWYRLFSPSLRHFAHLTLPNGRWRWSG